MHDLTLESFTSEDHPIDMSGQLTEGHKAAIVQMFSSGTSIAELAKWYRVPRAEVREILKPHIHFMAG